MGLILCATRGGEASYNTQQAAIDLAKERLDEIVFLYIIDLHFLDMTSAPIVVDVEHELEEMGKFFLLMAREKAFEQGVKARSITRKGVVREEIINAARDEAATLVVLGRPVGSKSAFQMESLQEFIDQIERETQAKAVMV